MRLARWQDAKLIIQNKIYLYGLVIGSLKSVT